MKKLVKDNLYYDGSENYVIDKKDYWKLDLIKKYPYTTGLDLGCGTGRWLNQFPTWMGVDVDSRAKNNRVKISSIEHLPFKKNSFNILLASHVLEHIEKKKFEKVILEINKVLKKDGVLIIFGPNPSHPNFYHDFTHVNSLDISSLSSILKNYGFEILEADFSIRKRFWFGRFLPSGFVRLVSPLFVTEYYVVSKKTT